MKEKNEPVDVIIKPTDRSIEETRLNNVITKTNADSEYLKERALYYEFEEKKMNSGLSLIIAGSIMQTVGTCIGLKDVLMYGGLAFEVAGVGVIMLYKNPYKMGKEYTDTEESVNKTLTKVKK